jgi:S1-C subfamily serine protease
VEAVHDLAPEPPDTSTAFGDLVGDGDFTGLIDDGVHGAPDYGPPPVDSPLGGIATGRAAGATVKITGRACSRIQEGTGFAAATDLVLTNAHVVAGEDRTEVETSDGRHLAATVVVFDAEADVAALHVPGLGVEALPLVATAEVHGVEGAVFGHPNGGGLEIRPARVGQVYLNTEGRDIYRQRPTTRTVLGLAATLSPGDSGAPVVDADGEVIGMAFAIDPNHAAVAYALAVDELGPVIDEAAAQVDPADTRDCLL